MPRLDARFAVNLRPETLDRKFRTGLRPWGYLAPPDNLTASTRSIAQTLRSTGRVLIVDNGGFDDIGRISRQLAGETAALASEIDELVDRLGHRPIRHELPERLRLQVDALARATAREAQLADGVAESAQLALNPSTVIGIEDITAATWLRVGLDAPLLADARRALRLRNQATALAGAAAARRLSSQAPGVRYLPVASAVNYDTALDAGSAFAKAGLTGAAMGFGAYMADDSFTDAITLHGRRHRLPDALPQRYLRCVLAACGFWDGWHRATRTAPETFHFLGLGAPIMMAVVAVAAASTPMLTFDATSPVKDAAAGTLYFSKPTYLKVRTRRAAQHLATGRWTHWHCRCPFCKAFTEAHPFDYQQGRAWQARHPGSVVGAANLRPGGALFDAYPLLSEPAAGALRREVTGARTGHNHWVLERILSDVRKHGQTRASLVTHVESIVSAYTRATEADHFATAVRTALALADSRTLPG